MWIFVSHSTEEHDAPGRQRLSDLRDALNRSDAGRPPQHDILIDFERIDAAAKWRSELDQWLAECQAAILLLTPRALNSPWVLKEATILAHRAALDPRFPLFPVLLDGATAQNLADAVRFSPLYLDAIERVRAQTATGIAAEVLQILAAFTEPPRRPLDDLIGELRARIQSGDAALLQQICESVTGAPTPWAPGDVRAERCAKVLANAVVTGQLSGYAGVGDLVNAIYRAGVTKENSLRVLRLVSPLWVPLEAAAPLADLARRNLLNQPDRPARAATAINGDYVPVFTAEMYMRRAYLPNTATVLSIHGGESDLGFEELVTKIRTEVRAREQLLALKIDKIDAYLMGLNKPFFIVLPPPMPDDALLEGLQKLFPRVTFIVPVDNLQDDAGSFPREIVLLVPPVDLAAELRALQEYNRSADSINVG